MATRTARVDVHLTPDDARAALGADVLLGLTARPKQLPPKCFYDARGSALFEEITALPEYYPTRTEAALLARARRRDRGAARGDDAGRARARGRRRRPGCCSTRSPAPGRCAATCRSTSARPRCATALDALAARYPALGAARRGRRLHPPPGPAAREGHAARRDRGSAARRLPRRHDRQPRTARSGPRSSPGCGPRCGRASTCCSARRWSRTRPCWWRPTTTPRGSRPSSTATSSTCSTASCDADFARRRVRPRRAAGTRSRSGSRCGCARSARWR